MRPKQRHLLSAQFGGEGISPRADGGPAQPGMLGPRVRHIHQTDRHQQRPFLAEQIVHRAVVQPLQIDALEDMLAQPFILLPREALRHAIGPLADPIGRLCWYLR